MTTSEALTAERGKTHGDWLVQSAISADLKDRLRMGPNWSRMRPSQREAVEHIATKLARIVAGDPAEPDHWDDIGGYALLGKEGHPL